MMYLCLSRTMTSSCVSSFESLSLMMTSFSTVFEKDIFQSGTKGFKLNRERCSLVLSG